MINTTTFVTLLKSYWARARQVIKEFNILFSFLGPILAALIWLWSGSEEPPVQRIELDITIQFEGLNPVSVPRGSEVEPPAAQPTPSDENDAIRQMLRDSFNLVDVRAATS